MDQIDQVKQKTDIVELINSYVPLKKAGRNFKALCPFHSEKTPSFIVSPERQIFRCFGCGVGGDVFKFLMEYEGMEFGEALRFLADRAGIKLKQFKPSKNYKEKKKLLEINHLASEYYHYILLNHPVGKKGLDYLLGRGVKKSLIKKFKLGYAPQAWRGLQKFLVNKKGHQQEALVKAGLSIRSDKGPSYYDRFRGRVVFPLFDHRGNVVGFAGRTLEKDLKGAKYINTPETRLYHKSSLLYGLNWTKTAIKKKDQAVVVEGEFDFISSYQAGVKNVVAIKGTALTKEQVSLIKRFTDNLALALDKDIAGDKAVKRGIEEADKQGLNIKIILLKYGKDPDECARHSAKLWRQSVKEIIPIYDFYLKSAVDRFGKKEAEAKKKISEELVPILAKITNQVVQAHYIKQLAQVLSVNEEAVLKEIERWERRQKIEDRPASRPEKESAAKEEKPRRERLEERLLSLVLQKKTGQKKLLEQVKLENIHSNPATKILEALKNHFKEKKEFKVNQFAQQLPQELIKAFDQAYLFELGIDLEDEEVFDKEWQNTLREIEKLALKKQLNQLVEQIKQWEKKGKEEKLNKARQKLSQLSKRLRELI